MDLKELLVKAINASIEGGTAIMDVYASDFEVEHKDDKSDGQGTYTFANGDKYVGDIKNGKWNGQGTYTFSNGSKHVGIWENNKLWTKNIL